MSVKSCNTLLREMDAAALREQAERAEAVRVHVEVHGVRPDGRCMYCTYRRRAS